MGLLYGDRSVDSQITCAAPFTEEIATVKGTLKEFTSTWSGHEST